jgi:6-phosphogluconolactonase
MMEILRCNSMDDVATAGANYIETRVNEAIKTRGQFTIALSGGSTPWIMLRKLAGYDLPWQQMKIFQTDERVAPDGDSDRNLTRIREDFADRVALPPENLLAMPVTGDDLDQAAAEYEKLLVEFAGETPVLDVVHLGLGGDGHTASLMPDDPVLDMTDRDVAPTDIYAGRRRMTLTYPVINRVRQILWLITGVGKAEVLSRLLQSDRDIPAGRVNQQQATVIADAAALPRQTRD